MPGTTPNKGRQRSAPAEDDSDVAIDPTKIEPKMKKVRKRYVPDQPDDQTLRKMAEAVRQIMREDRG